MKLRDGFVDLNNNIATAYFKQCEYKDSKNAAEKVLQIDGDNVKATVRLAHCLIETGGFDEAHDTLKNVVVMNPDDVGVRGACGALKRRKAKYKSNKKAIFQKMLSGGGDDEEENEDDKELDKMMDELADQDTAENEDEKEHQRLDAEAKVEAEEEEKKEQAEEKKKTSEPKQPVEQQIPAKKNTPETMRQRKDKRVVKEEKIDDDKKKNSNFKAPKGKLKFGGDIDDGETEEEWKKRMERQEFRTAVKEIGLWLCCVAVICYFGFQYAKVLVADHQEKRRLGLVK